MEFYDLSENKFHIWAASGSVMEKISQIEFPKNEVHSDYLPFYNPISFSNFVWAKNWFFLFILKIPFTLDL